MLMPEVAGRKQTLHWECWVPGVAISLSGTGKSSWEMSKAAQAGEVPLTPG